MRIPNEPLMLNARALGDFLRINTAPPNETRGDVTLVFVRGPLLHHADAMCDSYEAIRARVVAAFAATPKVLLVLDTPGGLVSGCFDTVRALRSLAAQPGRELRAFVQSAESAGYALATACSKITASAEARVGSIGVIETRLDTSAAEAAAGVRVTLVTSGARKADGNPHVVMSEEELQSSQSMIDQLADNFARLVAEARGLPAEAIRGLEAATLLGPQAVTQGLVDDIATLDEAVAGFGATEENGMGKAELVKALQAASESEDEETRSFALKALKALADEDEDEEKAESDEEDREEKAESDEEDRKEKAGAADANVLLAAALGRIERLERERELEKAAARRAELLASRPDFDADTVASLKDANLATVEYAVKHFPKVTPAGVAALNGVAPPTDGAEPGPGALPPELAAMTARAGAAPAAVRDGNILRLGVIK